MKLSEFIARANKLGAHRRPFFFVVDFEMQQPLIYPLHEIPNHISVQFPDFSNHRLPTLQPGNFRFATRPISYRQYHQACSHCINEIRKGYSYLLNLTFATRVNTDLSLQDIFRMSQAPYKMLFHNRFVVFSPERFMHIHQGGLHTYPMKGTIDADLPQAEHKILADAKEKAEHHTIADLLRNDMSQWCTRVKVDRFRYINRIATHNKNLLQVSSAISGELPPDFNWHMGQIIADLLPAGSVSGAPKPSTLRIIREAEEGQRGYYTGVMGYFDGQGLDSAVMIRFMEQNNGHMLYRSGGGITAQSHIEREYQEMLDKVYVPVY